MKNLLFILSFLILASCSKQSAKKNDSVIGIEFQKFNQIKQLSNYTKISDTTVYSNNIVDKHGILHLRNKTNNLVILNSISLDPKNENRIFKILDTLIIPNRNKPELITIGYCQMNKDLNESLIAIVDKTDSLFIQNIKQVWKANTISEKIESVNDLNGMNCFNEWYD